MVVGVDSPKLKESWCLATQIKMFSHAVDLLQKIFIEALSQTRFLLGGRISKQKFNAKETVYFCKQKYNEKFYI